MGFLVTRTLQRYSAKFSRANDQCGSEHPLSKRSCARHRLQRHYGYLAASCDPNVISIQL